VDRSHPKQDHFLVLAILLALFGLASYLAERIGEPHAGHLTPIAQRKPMSNLTVTTVDGNPWQLAQRRGQIILINFWATWCAPCRKETPGLVELAQDENLAILGISLDAGGDTTSNRAKVEAFTRSLHVPYPMAFPPRGSQLEFGMDLIPTTVLIDRQGRIARIYEGAVRQAVFQSDIDQLKHEQ
jgi:cytochrome c biogenesis protein CcmG, thiol:disulfide interchange protein DsbE